MKKALLFAIAVFCYGSTNLKAQGCSDAGFCTLGSMKPNQVGTENKPSQKLSILLNNGIGDENVYVFTPGIQYDKRWNSRWAFQSKLTGNFASGNLGTATGLGDIYLSGIYSPTTKSKWKTSFLFGTKIPLNGSNLKEGQKSLPMQYQSSLGTFDVIGGITLSNNKWLFAAGAQVPLTGTNLNEFLPIYWNTPEAAKYPPTNDFNRKADVLLKADYLAINTKKLTVHLGLLSIFHLGKDTYINANVSNKPIDIVGSDGLTLNGTFTSRYTISPKLTFGLSGGLPFVVRDVRPDGLTRKFVLSPEIIFHF